MLLKVSFSLWLVRLYLWKIYSVIGTAIHERFEKALKESDLPVTTEVKLEGEIAGYSVGGTADLLVWEEPDTCKIYDLKTMKAFPAKKAFNGEDTDKFLKQLSVYAYLLRQQGYNVNPIGSIEVLVVGWTQRDRDLPRTFRIDLPLMSDTEVEEYVKDRIDNISMEKVDCPVEWMCDNYCELKCVCPHYNNKGFENEES